MTGSMRSALEDAGGASIAAESEIYTMMASAIRAKKTRRQIEAEFRTVCQRRQVLFDALIGMLHDRVSNDMNFRRDADGGQVLCAHKGQFAPAADSSGSDASPGHSADASNGQHCFARDEPLSREGGHAGCADKAKVPVPPSRDTASLASDGQNTVADKANWPVPPASDPMTTRTAGRTLQEHRDRLRRHHGAGAMSARSYETRARVFGESWMLSYAIPNGPQLFDMTPRELRPMLSRMAGEGAVRAHAALVLKAVQSELKLLGRVPDDTPIGHILSPAAVARIADAYGPENLVPKAKKHWENFVTDLHGGTHA